MIKGGPLTLGRLFAIIGKLQSKGRSRLLFLCLENRWLRQAFFLNKEQYSSGRRGVTRNLVGRVTGAGVQISTAPPKARQFVRKDKLPGLFCLFFCGPGYAFGPLPQDKS
jgi:hypothetical protein